MTRGRRHPSPGIGRSAVVWNIRPNPSAARLYGVVTVNSQIGQDGRPFDTVLGRVELVYKFVLDGEDGPEAHTAVAFSPSNEYVVTSNPYGPICFLPQANLRRKS